MREKILREKNKLLEWSSTVSIESPDLRLLFDEIASYLEQKSSCQIAVSEKGGTLALMGPDRELHLYSLEDGTLVPISKVQVLGDSLPEWCILKWSQSQNLLISTRSSGVIDVFDSTGGYCYSITQCSAPEGRFKPSSVISHVQTVSASDGTDGSKWLDTLYVMQFDSTFSAFKLGRLSGYVPIFNVNLGLQLCTSFYFSPANRGLMVSSRYRLESEFSLITMVDPLSLGVNLFRVIDEKPFVIDWKAARMNKTEWRDWIPFLTKKAAVILTTSVNPKETLLAAVTSVGDLFVFSLPSMRVASAACAFQIDPLYRPTQVCWMNDQELCVMTKSGASLTESYKTICESLSNRKSTDLFSENSSIFSAEDVIFALEYSSTIVSEDQVGSQVIPSGKAWLAALLGLSTAWDWLKELTNGALGQPMEQLKSAAVDQRFDFTLHEMRNVTFEDSLQKMLRRREYDAAIDLSTEFGEEVDIVYKQKWIDRPQDYSKEFVMESLSQISDYSFVFTECCSNTNRSPEIQEIVLELLQSLCDHVDHHDRCIIYHYKRVWDIFMANEAPKVDCYLHFRRKSLLLIACSIAEEFDKDILRSILTANFEVLKPYILQIIGLIPESINPKLYESFLPRNASDLFEDIRRNSGQQKKYPYLDEHRDSASVKQLNFDLSETGFELAHRNAEDWFRERVFAIDQDSGNVDIMSKLLELAIERGFTQMREMHTEVEFYRDMVLFCGTNMSLESFSVTTSKKVVALLGKHLTEDDVCANIDRLISLFEHLKKSGRSEDVAADVVDLIALFSEKSLKLLGAVKERHRKYVSEEALVRCFCLFEATGDPLIAASKRLGIASNFISALEVFNAHGFHPRYEPVHKSLESDVSVEQILIQFFSSAKPETSADWIRLRDNAFKVRDLIYSEVMEKNTVLRLLAFKMLLIEDDSEVYNLQKCPTDVVLSFDPERKAQEKLSAAESIAVLIDLSRDYWNNAQPDINDPNLKKARQVLEIVPDKFKTVSMREYIRQLDVVECALRLGCTKLPVNIRFTEPEDLISECVQIGTNYKKVLKCAELALLLGFHNPKATAMELCAEQALKAKDEKVLATYVERLVSSAKGLSNICGVCIEVLKSPYLKNMRNELISCALLNCPLNVLNSTLQLIGEIENEAASEVPSTDEDEDYAENGIVCDAMYSTPEVYFRYRGDVENRKPVKYSSDPTRLARRYLRESSTVASAIMAQSGDISRPWTENTEVLRYTQALNEAVEAGVPVKMIEALTVDATIKTFLKEDRSNATPLERIINSGCDRTRFIEDPKYRIESLIGLAMTIDELELDDCVQVAHKFNHPVWPIYSSYIENLITDSGLSLWEIRSTLDNKPEMIQECIKGNSTKWHRMLRTTVAGFLDWKSLEWVRLYLELFGKDQQEGIFAKIFDQILALLPTGAQGQDWGAILSGKEGFLEALLVAMIQHSNDVKSVLKIAKELPGGTVACEDAAKLLFNAAVNDSSSEQKKKTLETCFKLLEDDSANVMELLSNLDENTEKRFIDEVLKFWDPYSEEKLRHLLQERQRVLLTPTTPYASEFGNPLGAEDFNFDSGFNDSTTITRRRC
ncbi:hypothetical protein L596_007543 [Steinernema carpocapsae]|uniref:Sec39 domain-containing protein n=1 Tax=Steinernema carpocapsae TaxID=34508 RepID=A0A4U5P9T2_STECR|nr:hypothetical protein L596_007543 [Steinernema carpocapsae]